MRLSVVSGGGSRGGGGTGGDGCLYVACFRFLFVLSIGLDFYESPN